MILTHLLFAAAWTTPFAGAQPAEKVVDLGHPLKETDPSWSGEKVFGRTATGTFEEDGAAMGRFFSDEHFGTHLDAPAHFSATGWTVDEIPVERLVRPGVRIRIDEAVRNQEDYRLTVEDVLGFERSNGRIAEGSIVLVSTGWSERWPDPQRYLNEREGVKHFPGISVAAASLLIDRKVVGIGIDTPSLDYGPSAEFETHRTTMPRNVYHIENATNLGDLPAVGFKVVVAPLKIVGGSGAPTRIFALIPAPPG